MSNSIGCGKEHCTPSANVDQERTAGNTVSAAHQPYVILNWHSTLPPGQAVVAAVAAAPGSKVLPKVGQQQGMAALRAVCAVLLHLHSAAKPHPLGCHTYRVLHMEGSKADVISSVL
jgi:hypothetical protein